MFESNILIKGIHAKYIKDLGGDHNGTEFKGQRLFNRYIDVYIAGAIVGISLGLKGQIDKKSEFANITANIMAEAVNNERTRLEQIYRTVMLLDEKSESYTTTEQKVNRAFRDDTSDDLVENHKKNQKVFLEYVLGGIEHLHEKIYDTNFEESLINMYEFFDNWNTRFHLSQENLDLKQFC